MNAQLNTASLTKVGTVTERGGYDMGLPGQPAGFKQAAGLDSEAVDKTGIDLGATGRLALMAKLAQGTGMQLPQAANQVPNVPTSLLTVLITVQSMTNATDSSM